MNKKMNQIVHVYVDPVYVYQDAIQCDTTTVARTAVSQYGDWYRISQPLTTTIPGYETYVVHKSRIVRFMKE